MTYKFYDTKCRPVDTSTWKKDADAVMAAKRCNDFRKQIGDQILIHKVINLTTKAEIIIAYGR